MSFEKAWDSDNRKSIEAFVAQVSEAMKPIVVRELVAVECDLRFASGEMPGRAGFQSRFSIFKDQADAGFDDWLAISGQHESPYQESLHPDKLGDYRIVRQIGQGGMGIVYEAIQESLDRRVAIKSLANHPLHVPKSAHRFRREARAVAGLHHTNIINIYGSGVHNGIPYFAMQFIDGQSLDCGIAEALKIRQSIQQHIESENPAKITIGHRLLGPDAFKTIAEIGIQVCNALQYAHDNGILHRDIKPGNLLIDAKGTTWVSDFGLAKLRQEDAQTISAEFVGTMRYSPPETFGGQWTEVGDIYSLGLTLYELVTLQPAYQQEDHASLIDHITRGDAPKKPKRINPTIPRDLETIIIKSISRDPHCRYQSAADCALDLKRFCNGESISARPELATEKAIRWAKRNPLPACLLSCILIMCLIGLPVMTSMWLGNENALEQMRNERLRADVAKKEAMSTHRSAEIQRIDTLHAAYGSSMQLAQKFMEEKRTHDAGSYLKEWNPESASSRNLELAPNLRGWEWSFLKQQIDSSSKTLTGQLAHTWYAQFSPDDRWIATVHAADHVDFNQDPYSEIVVWDAATGQKKYAFENEQGIFTGLTFNYESSTLATIAIDIDPNNNTRAYVQIWGLVDGQLIRSKQLSGIYDTKLLTLYGRPTFGQIRYSHDGKHLVVSPSPVQVLDARTLRPLWSVNGRHANFVASDKVALINDNDQFEIRDFESGDLLVEKSFQRNMYDIAETHDGKLLSTRIKNKLQIWAIDKMEAESVLKLREEFDFDEIYWGSIADSGNRVAYSDAAGRLFVKSRLNEKWYEKSFLGHDCTIVCGDFSSDGKRMVTASLDGTAKIWNLERTFEKKVFSTGLDYDQISDFAFSPNGGRLNYIARQQHPDATNRKHNAGSFNHDQQPSLKKSVDVTYSANWPRTDFTFSPDGKFALAPIAESTVPNSRGPSTSSAMGIWFVDDWSNLCIFDVKLDEINSVTWNKSSDHIAVAGRRNVLESRTEVLFFDVQELLDDAKSSQRLIDAQPHLAFQLDDRIITASAFKDDLLCLARSQQLLVIDLSDQNQNTNLLDQTQLNIKFQMAIEDKADLKFLDFSPDTTRLAAAFKGPDIARLYDLGSGETIFQINAPRNVSCVKFSPNGRRIALSGYEGIVYLCDANTGYRLLNLAASHRSPGMMPINSRVVFSSDGRKIATNTMDGDIIVWEAEPLDAKEIDELPINASKIMLENF